MSNTYFYFLALVTLLKIMTNTLVAYKIDATINLINETVVSSSITEISKIEALMYDDISYLAIDEDMFKDMVYTTMEENLSFTDYEVKYYFYDFKTKLSNKGYNNSVQFKISITYDGKTYERVKRYEPFEV